MPKSPRYAGASLAEIALDSGLEAGPFTDCLLKAWKDGKAMCGPLKIEHRQGANEEPIFLFMISDKVAGQFPLSVHFLNKPSTIQATVAFHIENRLEHGRPINYGKKKTEARKRAQ